uniref:Phage-related protein n=1 Tax=Chlorobium chlorochromatii (strain CaD3) TaxID=340177 RepID=Q3AQT2_CHLCH
MVIFPISLSFPRKRESNSLILLGFRRGNETTIIILLSGFQKKSQKTPQQEIDKAERLKKEYFDGKNKQ